MLFNEPKLLKFARRTNPTKPRFGCFSALQRAEIAEIYWQCLVAVETLASFSALQRAEIAEIHQASVTARATGSVSVLFNEPKLLKYSDLQRLNGGVECFSALQRAEIAEIRVAGAGYARRSRVSVLFNEPKLLKCRDRRAAA